MIDAPGHIWQTFGWVRHSPSHLPADAVRSLAREIVAKHGPLTTGPSVASRRLTPLSGNGTNSFSFTATLKPGRVTSDPKAALARYGPDGRHFDESDTNIRFWVKFSSQTVKWSGYGRTPREPKPPFPRLMPTTHHTDADRTPSPVSPLRPCSQRMPSLSGDPQRGGLVRVPREAARPWLALRGRQGAEGTADSGMCGCCRARGPPWHAPPVLRASSADGPVPGPACSINQG